MSVILELRNVTKSFGALLVVDSLSFNLNEGEALGILGPNGAGKTTLLNLISGDYRVSSGHILFKGMNITTVPAPQRCHSGIGRTYQIPRPFETLTVFENLLVGAVYGGRKAERAAIEPCAEILRRTGLIARANRPAGTLTLLERKRLELARALATGPELLLLDEIAGGLTEGECRALVETIKSIGAGGVTIVWIEHVVHALLAVVGRLIVLDFGRKIAEGEPRAVMNSPEVQEIYMGIAA